MAIKIISEERILITREEFEEYIALKTGAELVKNFIQKEGYISKDCVCAIFGIEVENGKL
jgi:effector-binding domain-containing protein